MHRDGSECQWGSISPDGRRTFFGFCISRNVTSAGKRDSTTVRELASAPVMSSQVIPFFQNSGGGHERMQSFPFDKDL